MCELRSDRNRLAVAVDDDFRVERRDAKERRQLVLRKPVQDNDIDRSERGDTRKVGETRATASNATTTVVRSRAASTATAASTTIGPLVPSDETTALSTSARSSSDVFFHSGGTDAMSWRVRAGESVLCRTERRAVATPRSRCGGNRAKRGGVEMILNDLWGSSWWG